MCCACFVAGRPVGVVKHVCNIRTSCRSSQACVVSGHSVGLKHTRTSCRASQACVISIPVLSGHPVGLVKHVCSIS